MTSIEPEPLSIDRVIACSHVDYPNYRKDFSEFWIGAAAKETRGTMPSKGDFRGRPVLAEGLWPAIRDELQGRKPHLFQCVFSALRSFWRFLDAFERQGFAPVLEVADIRSGLAMLWLNPVDRAWDPSNSSQSFEMIGKLLRRTRERLRLADAWVWCSFPNRERTATKDLPSDAQVRASMSLLKQTAYAIYRRWKRADVLASVGRNLLEIPRNGRCGSTVTGMYSTAFDFEPTEADAHATYRAFIAKSGNPLPSRLEFFKGFGLQGDSSPNWWPKYEHGHLPPSELQFRTVVDGLYPTNDDIDCLALLCMARSGWNPSTVYALDVSTARWATLHGEAGSPLWLIEAFKDRARAWQWTLSPERLSTGFHHIVSLLIQRTKPLRALIEDDATRCDTPAIALRSPWISAGLQCAAGRVLVRSATNAGAGFAYWKRLVREHNDRAAPDKLIQEFIAPSDWRDIYASHV